VGQFGSERGVVHLLHEVAQAGLEAREAEAGSVFACEGAGELVARAVAACRRMLDQRTAGIGHAEELRPLVERLPSRIVQSLSEHTDRTFAREFEEQCVPARDDEAEMWQPGVEAGSKVGGGFAVALDER
jgi:hypothetical protein